MTGPDLELAVGGRPLRFPAVWLRDNCPCPECVAPGTGQKINDILSQESVRTLAFQGGPMTPQQAAAFEALPFAQDAVAARRWDDEAKDPWVTPPEFAHFAALLESLAQC